MTSKIKRLESADIYQICSQQVILDLGHCVKELVENSLDAGSTQIEIRFKRFGLDGFEVADNGTGIGQDEFQLLTQRHTTSKLREYDDLESIRSFGFRGEALSSICSLASLQIITSTCSPYGFKLGFNEFGKLVEKCGFPRQQGTTVTVSNLFHALPVRLKDFEKNCKREYHKCIQILQEYSLITIGVRISVVHILNGERNVVISTPGGTDMKDNITAILGHKISQLLIPVNFEFHLVKKLHEDEEETNKDQSVKVTGYISKPLKDHGRSALDKQYFYLFQRPCSFPKISRKINEVYKSFNPLQNPIFILQFHLPAGTFDVNVTPDKRTILLHDEQVIINTIKVELEAMFEPFRGAFELNQGMTSFQTILKSDESSVMKGFAFKKPLIQSTEEHVVVADEVPNEVIDLTNYANVDIVHEMKVKRLEGPVVDLPVKRTRISLFNETASNHSTKLDSLSSASREHDQIVHDINVNESPSCCSHKVQRDLTPIPNKIPEKEHLIALKKSATLKCNLAHIKERLLEKKQSISSENHKTEKQELAEESAERNLERILGKKEFQKMKIIGQFNLGFILALLPSTESKEEDTFDMFVIDQHASDEIFLFHKYQRQTTIETQKLACPKSMDIPADQMLLALEYEDFFRKNGFCFDVLKQGDKRILRLTSLPVLYGKVLSVSDFEELLALKSEDISRQDLRCSKVRSVFASKACRTAWMIGDPLNQAQMKRIVENLSTIEKPWVY